MDNLSIIEGCVSPANNASEVNLLSTPQRMFKAVFPGKYIQGENAIAELPCLINLLGKKGLIIASPTVAKTILPPYNICETEGSIVVEQFRGECCESELFRLTEIICDKAIDVVVGMGGGKTIDTAKIVSDRANLPVIIVPTIASSDAPCSGCAVIYSEAGVFESVYYQKLNPQMVLVDMTVYSFCELIGLPTTFSDLGMQQVDRTQLMKVAHKATLPGEYIHHEAGCITPVRILDAMIAADAMGRSRKNRIS